MNAGERNWADLVLRAGLAFAFLYPAIDEIFDPNSWLGYFPHFVRAAAQTAHIPDMVLLHGFGTLEVIIALWVLSGRAIVWPSLAAAAILATIVLMDIGDLQITFRDVSIMSIAVALAIRHWPRSAAIAYDNA